MCINEFGLRYYGLIMLKSAVEVIKKEYALSNIKDGTELKFFAERLGVLSPDKNQYLLSCCDMVLGILQDMGINGVMPCGLSMSTEGKNYVVLAEYLMTSEDKDNVYKDLFKYSPLVLRKFFANAPKDVYTAGVVGYLSGLICKCDAFLSFSLGDVCGGISESKYQDLNFCKSVVYAIKQFGKVV